MIIQISEKLKKLAKILPGDLYVVGGYIRNSLMGIENDDVDICSEVKLEELEFILKGSEFEFKIKNKTLGTAIITCEQEQYEYSVLRREIYPDGGAHSPAEVEFISDIKEDAKRRDFTINAIYYNIKKDELSDFYGGIDDIKHKILRTVETPEEVLSKDGARVLRLFRFQCELGLKIDKSTLHAAIKYADLVRDLSSERKTLEITKILHSGVRYASSKNNAFMRAFKVFNRYGLWPNFGFDVPKIKFNMVKKVEHKSQGFLIDLIDTVNPISVSYYLEQILSSNMGLPKKMSANLINILCGYYAALNRQDNKTYFFKYFDNFPTIFLLVSKKNKILAMKYEFFYKYIISHRLIISVKELKINGDDIKKHYPRVQPKRYKAILESLLSDVFDCKLNNDNKELIAAVEQKLKYL